MVILLFRTHHKSILPLEKFFERLGGMNISLSNSRIFKLRIARKTFPVEEEFYSSHKFRPKTSFQLEKFGTGRKVPHCRLAPFAQLYRPT